MTKRDSVAGFDSPRHHTSMQRRQFNHPFQPRSGDASSTTATSSAPAMSSWDHHPHQTHDSAHGRTSSNAHAYGYTSEAPPVPLPADAHSYPQEEAYPLQAEIQQEHRVLHTHIFKEVMAPPIPAGQIASWLRKSIPADTNETANRIFSSMVLLVM